MEAEAEGGGGARNGVAGCPGQSDAYVRRNRACAGAGLGRLDWPARPGLAAPACDLLAPACSDQPMHLVRAGEYREGLAADRAARLGLTEPGVAKVREREPQMLTPHPVCTSGGPVGLGPFPASMRVQPIRGSPRPRRPPQPHPRSPPAAARTREKQRKSQRRRRSPRPPNTRRARASTRCVCVEGTRACCRRVGRPGPRGADGKHGVRIRGWNPRPPPRPDPAEVQVQEAAAILLQRRRERRQRQQQQQRQ